MERVLTEADFIRYGRQILYTDFGESGQERLKRSHVVVAGLGGLGSPASIYLASAGIGHLTLVDCDVVELSTLNRQVLYGDEDIGEKKPVSAARKLAQLNPAIGITPLFERITEDNVNGIIEGANVVIDGMDNFETRLILNAGCVAKGVPLIHGGVYGLLGEITTIVPGETPCLACIIPTAPKKRSPFPILGATPALIAALQVAETIKLLAGFGDLLANRMLYVNGSTMAFDSIPLTKNPACRVCGNKEGM